MKHLKTYSKEQFHNRILEKLKVSKNNYDIGKSTWRKIMYLCKCCGYRYMITNFEIAKREKVESPTVEELRLSLLEQLDNTVFLH